MAEVESTRPPIPRHMEIAYKDAIDNILAHKSHQIGTTRYTYLAYAAHFTIVSTLISRGFDSTLLSFQILYWFPIFIAAVSLAMLFWLQRAIVGYRYRLRRIYSTYFSENDMKVVGTALHVPTSSLLVRPRDLVVSLTLLVVLGAAIDFWLCGIAVVSAKVILAPSI